VVALVVAPVSMAGFCIVLVDQCHCAHVISLPCCTGGNNGGGNNGGSNNGGGNNNGEHK
jgi:hypothetical protein